MYRPPKFPRKLSIDDFNLYMECGELFIQVLKGKSPRPSNHNINHIVLTNLIKWSIFVKTILNNWPNQNEFVNRFVKTLSIVKDFSSIELPLNVTNDLFLFCCEALEELKINASNISSPLTTQTYTESGVMIEIPILSSNSNKVFIFSPHYSWQHIQNSPMVLMTRILNPNKKVMVLYLTNEMKLKINGLDKFEKLEASLKQKTKYYLGQLLHAYSLNLYKPIIYCPNNNCPNKTNCYIAKGE